MKCQDCLYWVRYRHSMTKGQCRRYSPELREKLSGWFFLIFGGLESESAETSWPETLCDDWCGNFTSKIKISKTTGK